MLYSGLIADRVNLRYFLAVGMIGEWKRNHVRDLIHVHVVVYFWVIIGREMEKVCDVGEGKLGKRGRG